MSTLNLMTLSSNMIDVEQFQICQAHDLIFNSENQGKKMVMGNNGKPMPKIYKYKNE